MALPVSGRKSVAPSARAEGAPAFAAKGTIPGAMAALTVLGLLTVFGEPVMAWLSPPDVRAGDGTQSSGSEPVVSPAAAGPSTAQGVDAGDSAHGRDR